MVHRIVVLPLASVLVGLILLAGLGVAPPIVHRGPQTHAAKPGWLAREMERLGWAGQMMSLGITRRDLREAGKRLGIHSLDKKSLIRLADSLGLAHAADPFTETADAAPAGRVIGMSLAGLGLSGLVGAPFVCVPYLVWRRLGKRRRAASAVR